MLPPLTEREKRILFFLRMWQIRKRYTPTAGDIGLKFGVGKQTIQQVLVKLRQKGYIEVAQEANWRRRQILFPKGTDFPWGNEQLPDELFDHMYEKKPEPEVVKQEVVKEVSPNDNVELVAIPSD